MFNKITISLIFALCATSCFSQIVKKQVRIPLNDTNGVPYFHINGKGMFAMDGFDADSTGNYYFMARDYEKGTAHLAVFKGDKLKYRKTYNTYFLSRIMLKSNKIYLLDYSYNRQERKYKNDFYQLDASNGNILKKQKHVFENNIYSYEYLDNLIVLWMFDTAKPMCFSNSFYELMNLQGKIIGKAANQNKFNLPDSFLPRTKSKIYMGMYFLGHWGKDSLLVFANEEMKTLGPNGTGVHIFYFEDKYGNYLGTSKIDRNKFGKIFFGDEDLSWILRNGKVYVLGQDSKNAIITELSVEELYKDALQHKEK